MKHTPDISVQTVNACVDSNLATRQLIKTKIYKIASALKDILKQNALIPPVQITTLLLQSESGGGKKSQQTKPKKTRIT